MYIFLLLNYRVTMFVNRQDNKNNIMCVTYELTIIDRIFKDKSNTIVSSY